MPDRRIAPNNEHEKRKNAPFAGVRGGKGA